MHLPENNEKKLQYKPALFPASLSAAVCPAAGSLCLSAAAVCLAAGSLSLSAGQVAAARRWWHGSHLFLSEWPSRWPC